MDRPAQGNRYSPSRFISLTFDEDGSLIVHSSRTGAMGVVPPDQAETFVEACRKKKLPYAYVAYEGEQHGFRQDKNIRRVAEGELYFLSRIFGFKPADEIEPVEIENFPSPLAGEGHGGDPQSRRGVGERI